MSRHPSRIIRQDNQDAKGNPIMEGKKVETQIIPQGPVASQEAIKMLGTNGGGFFNANSAHPYENPTPLTNFIQMLSIFLIPTGLTYYLGSMVKNQRHGWTIWATMLALFLVAALSAGMLKKQATRGCMHWASNRSGKHGGKGGPVRDLRFRPFRHHNN